MKRDIGVKWKVVKGDNVTCKWMERSRVTYKGVEKVSIAPQEIVGVVKGRV